MSPVYLSFFIPDTTESKNTDRIILNKPVAVCAPAVIAYINP